ncbi:hypothetical protein CYMTET_54742 [Cymbomonas tetramitiformis]|uniref:Uncharacterized protein n=1 Tax=Cymbomonas tetramitiformis TaxID=36881 RepID=A0AAE0BEM7_9CHLO|nr:hypothetical protein CYMTET_54742 [Cymbomonas tetramitiformis]
MAPLQAKAKAKALVKLGLLSNQEDPVKNVDVAMYEWPKSPGRDDFSAIFTIVDGEAGNETEWKCTLRIPRDAPFGRVLEKVKHALGLSSITRSRRSTFLKHAAERSSETNFWVVQPLFDKDVPLHNKLHRKIENDEQWRLATADQEWDSATWKAKYVEFLCRCMLSDEPQPEYRGSHGLWELAQNPEHHKYFTKEVMKTLIASLSSRKSELVLYSARITWALSVSASMRSLLVACKGMRTVLDILAWSFDMIDEHKPVPSRKSAKVSAAAKPAGAPEARVASPGGGTQTATVAPEGAVVADGPGQRVPSAEIPLHLRNVDPKLQRGIQAALLGSMRVLVCDQICRSAMLAEDPAFSLLAAISSHEYPKSPMSIEGTHSNKHSNETIATEVLYSALLRDPVVRQELTARQTIAHVMPNTSLHSKHALKCCASSLFIFTIQQQGRDQLVQSGHVARAVDTLAQLCRWAAEHLAPRRFFLQGGDSKAQAERDEVAAVLHIGAAALWGAAEALCSSGEVLRAGAIAVLVEAITLALAHSSADWRPIIWLLCSVSLLAADTTSQAAHAKHLVEGGIVDQLQTVLLEYPTEKWVAVDWEVYTVAVVVLGLLAAHSGDELGALEENRGLVGLLRGTLNEYRSMTCLLHSATSPGSAVNRLLDEVVMGATMVLATDYDASTHPDAKQNIVRLLQLLSRALKLPGPQMGAHLQYLVACMWCLGRSPAPRKLMMEEGVLNELVEASTALDAAVVASRSIRDPILVACQFQVALMWLMIGDVKDAFLGAKSEARSGAMYCLQACLSHVFPGMHDIYLPPPAMIPLPPPLLKAYMRLLRPYLLMS